MADDNNFDIMGKKTFFVHPSNLTQSEIIPELSQHDFEAYIIKDESRLMKLLRRYPQSILFASIDEKLQAREWETLIRQIKSGAETKNVAIGVVTGSHNEEMQRLYLTTIGVQCGYIATKPDLPKALKQILDVLKAVDAKGRRKYIRANTENDPGATLNISLEGSYIKGVIKDISAIGFSCSFPENPKLGKNSLLSDVQLKLQSSLLKVEGIVFGSRIENNETVYVVIFTQKTDPAARARIRTYVQHSNQVKLEQEMK